jgi:uncharacterized protein
VKPYQEKTPILFQSFLIKNLIWLFQKKKDLGHLGNGRTLVFNNFVYYVFLKNEIISMSEEAILSIVKKYALENSENDDIHGFPHIERVYNLCLLLGKKLGANLFLLKIAAYLHDIGRIHIQEAKNNKNHAENSAEIALNLLKSCDCQIPQTDFDNIIHIIRAHSFSNNVIPKTLEAKILSDADKLDALGAIGLYRTIGFTIKKKGSLDQVIEHLENKILKLKNQLYLDISKRIAKEREQIINDFYIDVLKQK